MKTRDLISGMWSEVNKGHSADIPVEFHVDSIRVPIEGAPEVKVIDGNKVMAIPVSSVSFDKWLEDINSDRYTYGHEAGYSEGYAAGVQDMRDKKEELRITK